MPDSLKSPPVVLISTLHGLIGFGTYFLRLLDCDLSGAPGDDVEIDKGVEDE